MVFVKLWITLCVKGIKDILFDLFVNVFFKKYPYFARKLCRKGIVVFHVKQLAL